MLPRPVRLQQPFANSPSSAVYARRAARPPGRAVRAFRAIEAADGAPPERKESRSGLGCDSRQNLRAFPGGRAGSRSPRLAPRRATTALGFHTSSTYSRRPGSRSSTGTGTTRDRAANVRLFRLAAEDCGRSRRECSIRTWGGSARSARSGASAGRGDRQAEHARISSIPPVK